MDIYVDRTPKVVEFTVFWSLCWPLKTVIEFVKSDQMILYLTEICGLNFYQI